jgi:hypothetical protein
MVGSERRLGELGSRKKWGRARRKEPIFAQHQ